MRPDAEGSRSTDEIGDIMQVFFEAVRAEPWPFIAAGILLICLLSQVFADSSDPDLPGLGD
jgi:hypothetical protein